MRSASLELSNVMVNVTSYFMPNLLWPCRLSRSAIFGVLFEQPYRGK
jgi:hypothetical protein